MQLDLFSPLAGRQLPVWTVRIGGRTVHYTLKRSARARQVWLRIGIGTGLEVVAPERMPLRELDGVLQKKARWIEKHALPVPAEDGMIKPSGKDVLRGGVRIPYLGEPHPLRVLVEDVPAPSVRLVSGEIVATVPDKDMGGLKEALEGWYRKMARKVITERVAKLSDGRRIGRVSIRDQRTRWGSCSPLGNLNFNWRLVMAPRRVIDYMVFHELTHLEHPDHSKRFWTKVAKRCPGYLECEAWLKKHGRGLPF